MPTSPERFRLEGALILVLGLALPFADFPLFSIGRFGLDVAHIAAGLLVLVAAAAVLRGEREGPPFRVGLAALLLLAAPLVPLLLHRLPGFSMGHLARSWMHLAFVIGVFLALFTVRLPRETLDRIFGTLALEAAALSLYGIWQVIAFARGWSAGIALLDRIALRPLRGYYGGGWRATATLEEPKWLAIYLLAPLVYAAVRGLSAARAGRVRQGVFWVGVMAVLCCGALATGSLGVLPGVALLALALLLVVMRELPGRVRASLAAGLLVLAVGAGTLALRSGSRFSEMLRLRLAAERTYGLVTMSGPTSMPSWTYRENFRFALAIFREAPLFGIGPGQFGPVGAVRGVALGFPVSMTSDGPWIGFGGILAEYGLAGLGLFVFLLLSPLRRDVTAAGLCATVFWTTVSAGFYATLWTWFPLGLAAASRPDDSA
jgi:hypothetical protein